MRKLLFVAVMAVLALQPVLGFGDPLPAPKHVPDVTPTIINHGPFTILQAIPAAADGTGLPGGAVDTSFCVVKNRPDGQNPTITFVGNVLCLNPGPNGDFGNWITPPEGRTVVIQGVKLIKTVPFSPKCPDVYPGMTCIQTPLSTGIRTWWPLKFSPCNTTFKICVEYALVSAPSGGTRGVPTDVITECWTFQVRIPPEVLSWVLQALHVEPLGVCEVPCITDEGLFSLLLSQADAVRRAARNGDLVAINNSIDTMEWTLVRYANFLTSVAQVNADGTVIPCTLFPDGCPWGNYTVPDFGWGIVDTLENPCVCKLVTDLFCLKTSLIGTDP